MGTSTVSGPFRSANGFQELVNGQWVPVAGGGGGGGVPNTCLVQVPINIDCAYDYPGFYSATMKLDLPFTVQEVGDSIASGGTWAKLSGYSVDLTIMRYPRAGTPFANECYWWGKSYMYSTSSGPFIALVANASVYDGGSYGYCLIPSVSNPTGYEKPPVVTYGPSDLTSSCMSINYWNPNILTGYCGSPFACNTSLDSNFCFLVGFCTGPEPYLARCFCGVDIEAQGYQLTGVANVQFNFFNQ